MITKRYSRILAAGAFLLIACSSAFSQSFDSILGEFAQRMSGTCVIYAHVLSVAESSPTTVKNMVHPVFGGWMVNFEDGRKTYVAQSILDRSIAAGYSCGESDNILTICSVALSMRSGGFNYKTGQLDYGKVEFDRFLGTGKWTLYDPDQGIGKGLPDGLNRLAKESAVDGHPKDPCTMGFGILDEKTVPKYIDQIKKLNLLGGHDYSVSSYDATNKIVHLRNPHRPKEIMNVPVKLLLSIPCGIDFMEPKVS